MNKLNKLIFSMLVLLLTLSSCGSETVERPFTVAIVDGFKSISPGVDVGALSKSVLKNMNATLYKYNTETKVQEPALAKEISVDGGVCTITLKEGIYFHNDKEVKAEDVAYSLKRVAGLVPEFTAVNENLVGVIKEDSIEIVDDYTLKLNIDENLINDTVLYGIGCDTIIVPSDYSEEDQTKVPISAGPYKFVSYTPGQEINFTKWDKSYSNTAEITDVCFKIISDTSTSLFALQNGEIDYLSLQPDDVKTLEDGGFTGTVYTDMANDTNTLFLNLGMAPFNDPEICKAINYAINKDELIDITTSGYGLPQASVLSPYQKNLYNENLTTNEFDPTLSKRILESKGYSDTNRLSFSIKVVAENRVTVNMANMVKSYLADCYIDAYVYEIPWSTYFNEVYMNKDFEATILQLAGYENPYNTLRFFETGYVGNLSGYSSEAYDKVANEILAGKSEDTAALYKEAQQILFDDTPAIFLGDEGKLVGLSEGYTGVEFYPYWFIDISKIKVVK